MAGKRLETPDGLRHRTMSDHISPEKWEPESALYTVQATNTANPTDKGNEAQGTMKTRKGTESNRVRGSRED